MSENGIVISSRVRLARNIAGLPFPSKLDSERSLAVTQKVYGALGKAREHYSIIRISDMSDLQGEALKEMHLISDDLLHGNKYAAAIMNKSNDVCIMVNEEDHIREQCILPGKKLRDAYVKINEIDDIISSSNKIAFDPRLGYLTSCPTNVGTGMRASALMFLPGLSLTNSLERCMNAVSRFDLTVRGEYGEGTSSESCLYQISNQKTLGLSESDILANVTAAVEQIERNEIAARKALLAANGTALRDNIMRAYGILSNAYALSGKEFMQRMALVKLGIYYEFLKCEDRDALEKLIADVKPASMMLKAGKIMDGEERDVCRAEKVSSVVGKVVSK